MKKLKMIFTWVMALALLGAFAVSTLAAPGGVPGQPPGPAADYINDNQGEVDNLDIADGTISPEKITGIAWTALNDGAGSGLDADTIDGSTSADFAGAAHDHDGTYSAIAHHHDADYYTKAIADAMFSQLGHDHDLTYYTQAAADAAFASLTHNHDTRYISDNAGEVDDQDIADGAISASKVNTTGLDADTVDGMESSEFIGKVGAQSISDTLTVSGLAYDTAQTGYLSIPALTMVPSSGVNNNFFRGVYVHLTSGSGSFYAPVHLPQGAIVTNMTYHFYDDNSSGSTWAALDRLAHGASSAAPLARVDSDDVTDAAAWNSIEKTPSSATIDNANYTYFVVAHLSAPTNSMRISNIVLEYTYTTPGG